MHLASAMNAPTCAVYCSTVPAFGFSPLSERSFIVEIDYPLYCRPCGLHGYNACPEKHFKCAYDIEVKRLADILNKITAGKD
jgi:heptosyltransferase-2